MNLETIVFGVPQTTRVNIEWGGWTNILKMTPRMGVFGGVGSSRGHQTDWGVGNN